MQTAVGRVLVRDLDREQMGAGNADGSGEGGGKNGSTEGSGEGGGKNGT
jgi:hypothetical protein